MKKLSLVTLAGLISFALLPVQNAFAHVLVRDTSGSKGAILHIIPDDDPIAGKRATLFFDMQNDAKNVSKITLDITQQGYDKSVSVKTSLEGSLVTADFTFPSQGVYLLKYRVDVDGKTYIFEQSTRISRGAIIGSVERRHRTWAEGLLAACGISLAALIIIAFNRRHDIAKQSTF